MIQKTHREISSIKRMDDEGFISQVDNSWDTVARLQGSHWSWDELTSRKVLDGPMIITMFDVLSKYMNKNHVRTKDTRILGWPTCPILMVLISMLWYVTFQKNPWQYHDDNNVIIWWAWHGYIEKYTPGGFCNISKGPKRRRRYCSTRGSIFPIYPCHAQYITVVLSEK